MPLLPVPVEVTIEPKISKGEPSSQTNAVTVSPTCRFSAVPAGCVVAEIPVRVLAPEPVKNKKKELPDAEAVHLINPLLLVFLLKMQSLQFEQNYLKLLIDRFLLFLNY